MIGTVYKSTGSWYKVKLENGKFIDCRLLGKFREKNIKSTNPWGIKIINIIELILLN